MFIHTAKSCSTKIRHTYKDWKDEQWVLGYLGVTRERLYELLYHDISTGIYYKILSYPATGYHVDSYKSYMHKARYMRSKGIL